MRDKKAVIEAAPTAPKRKHHIRRALFIIALGALAGYFFGFNLDEEKRSRLGKLMFEGREMWFRIFV